MIDKQISSINILVADDDPDDRFMLKKAIAENKMKNRVDFVEDGEELMDFLNHRGKYSGDNTSPRPGLILLDLNMPKKDGREALTEIKSDPDLRRIPVIILTTSKEEEDILTTYNLGVNSFITKPVSFDSLIEVVKTIREYWLEIVTCPKD